MTMSYESLFICKVIGSHTYAFTHITTLYVTCTHNTYTFCHINYKLML